RNHVNRGFKVDDSFWVVLQVRTNTRRVNTHINANLFKVFSWADTGEHQQLRRVNRAGRNDDLTLCVENRTAAKNITLVFNSSRVVVFVEHNAGNPYIGEDIWILTALNWVKIGYR